MNISNAKRCRIWRQENPELMRKLKKSWNDRNPDRLKKHAITAQLKRYGLTEEAFAAMLEKQGGVCAICHKECVVYSRLCVDHDKETEVVRGLLCNHCNSGLGKFFHSEELLKSAIEYLSGNHSPISITIDPFLSRVLEAA